MFKIGEKFFSSLAVEFCKMMPNYCSFSSLPINSVELL